MKFSIFIPTEEIRKEIARQNSMVTETITFGIAQDSEGVTITVEGDMVIFPEPLTITDDVQ